MDSLDGFTDVKGGVSLEVVAFFPGGIRAFIKALTASNCFNSMVNRAAVAPVLVKHVNIDPHTRIHDHLSLPDSNEYLKVSSPLLSPFPNIMDLDID